MKNEKLIKKHIDQIDANQIGRIRDDLSKTRLSILFYGFTRDLRRIGSHTIKLLSIFRESF